MLHLRIVVPEDRADEALAILIDHGSVCNVVRLAGAAQKPAGDVLLADVPREDASLVLHDLKALDIPERGSIALENIDTAISDAARRAEDAASGLASDAVVWEQVEEETSENVSLSVAFLAFMVIATLIAAVGILNDSPVLIVGAMVVGPEFGPVAGLCVAVVQRRADLALRSTSALAVGFPLAIAITYAAVLALRAIGVAPGGLSLEGHPLTEFISSPDFFSFFVAFLAGAAGVLSLTSAKSGALIGVLISVTTIPAAGNIGLAAAYRDWVEVGGAAAQLGINLVALVLAGVLTLALQRAVYGFRRRRHLRRQDAARPPGQASSLA